MTAESGVVLAHPTASYNDVSNPQAVDIAYRPPIACSAAGITYRQLDYWARTGLVVPSVRTAAGSGTQRLYSFRDIVLLRVVRCLLDTGASLQNIRTLVTALDDQATENLPALTLLTDGATVHAAHTADEIVELLQGSYAVLAIALAGVVAGVTECLSSMPGEVVS